MSAILDPVDATADAGCRQRFAQVYDELKRVARRELRRAPANTLGPTALVHEVYLRLAEGGHDADGRGVSLALAARAMRFVLVDHVRARNAGKRGGDLVRVTLMTDMPLGKGSDPVDVLAIERGLQLLASVDPRLVTVVECRFFAGMSFDEIASHLGVSERTVQRDWRRARVFLLAQMGPPA